MAILRFRKDAGVRISLSFVSTEFDCKCEEPGCETQIDESLLNKLEALRKEEGAPLRINSGYRCQHYQDELRLRGYETSGGVSQHTLGRASDVSRVDERKTGVELETSARKVGFMAVGVASSWVHLDLRNDKERRWEYKAR